MSLGSIHVSLLFRPECVFVDAAVSHSTIGHTLDTRLLPVRTALREVVDRLVFDEVKAAEELVSELFVGSARERGYDARFGDPASGYETEVDEGDYGGLFVSFRDLYYELWA